MGVAPIKVAVTGGAGQIAYSLLFRLANGELFGPNQPISLHILEVPEVLEALKGVKMELEDCAFPLLSEIVIGSNPREVFAGVEYAFLVGAKPRGPGMERKDLLGENGKIFVEQGKALNDVASRQVKVLVVGNPCNTNCLIALHNAPDLDPRQFLAMTRLDENRAVAQIAKYAKQPVASIRKMTIWGNHSSTQVPDFRHVTIDKKPISQVIKDLHWLENDFISTVQKRGAEVIAARGKSSAASAASAALDAMKAWLRPTMSDSWFSCGLYTAANSYDIDGDLVFSFPCTHQGIVNGVSWNGFIEERIRASEKELKEERELVKHYLRK